MAAIETRKNKDKTTSYRVRWRDASGRKFLVTFDRLDKAKAKKEDVERSVREVRESKEPVSDRDITVKDYAARWLTSAAGGLSRRTLQSYRYHLDAHVLPILGDHKVRELTHGDALRLVEQVQQLALKKGEGKPSKDTVRLAHATLRRLLTRARFDGLVAGNVALGTLREVSSYRRLGKRRTKDEVRAFAPADLAKLWKRTAELEPGWHLLWVTMWRTGMRTGEAMGLQLGDVDLAGRAIDVRRSVHPAREGMTEADRVGGVKDHEMRTVEMSTALVHDLSPLIAQRLAANIRYRSKASPWLWPTSTGTAPDESRMLRAWRRCARKAGIPKRLTPYSLRHTWATTMLANGAPLLWVSQQLGHSSPEVTLKWYAWAMPVGKPGLSDLLEKRAAHTVPTRRRAG